LGIVAAGGAAAADTGAAVVGVGAWLVGLADGVTVSMMVRTGADGRAVVALPLPAGAATMTVQAEMLTITALARATTKILYGAGCTAKPPVPAGKAPPRSLDTTIREII
jgi:hypothetical protein